MEAISSALRARNVCRLDHASSVSPSTETWPQESAATATQDSTHSSAETAKPSGDTATPPGDFITIHGVKLPLVKINTTMTRDGVSVVNATLGLFKDEHTDWWENYRSVKDRLIPAEVGAHQLVPVQHDSLSALGITTLLFIRVSTPREVRGRYEVALEGVPPRQRSAEGLPRPLAVMQARAAATAVYPGAGTGDSDARYYTALALAGEAGEVAGKASKVLRDGEHAFSPGLLSRAHGGVLYVDEVNLLHDHLVDILLDAAARAGLGAGFTVETYPYYDAASRSVNFAGMLAALTPLPVIGVPVALKHLDGLDSLLSIVQMPAGVPVATVAETLVTFTFLLRFILSPCHLVTLSPCQITVGNYPNFTRTNASSNTGIPSLSSRPINPTWLVSAYSSTNRWKAISMLSAIQ